MVLEIAQIDDQRMNRRAAAGAAEPRATRTNRAGSVETNRAGSVETNRAGSVERVLLARLGLGGGASAADIETAHDDLLEFLDSAPRDLRAWADAQMAAADEAYALLSDPTATRPAAAVIHEPRIDADEPDETDEADEADELDELDEEPVRRSRRKPAARSHRRTTAAPRRIGTGGRMLMAAAGLVAALTVGYIVYASGSPGGVPGLNGSPAPESSQAALDTARVAQLMANIQADPNDKASLQELGDLYFQAGEYGVAADWENKIQAIDPNDVTAHLALGAADYNLGDPTSAEQQWRAALAIDPQNVEAHYDLGFMYFSQDPPDVDQTIAEWQQVIDLAPDSTIAQTIATHMATLESMRASESPGASAAPASPAPAAPAPTASAPAVTAAP
jgi:tetratricopeptide (TPR) repeat protein